jgi:DNA-binding NarL/FixJ family response regulator
MTLKKPPMTIRMGQVAGFIALGYLNKETADELGISVKTVEKHRGRLMAAFGLRNTADITRFAILHRIISLKTENQFN